MKTDGHETNNDRPKDFRLSDRVFRLPCRLDRPPRRAREADHQGARFGYGQIGRFSPTTVVAARTGGAPRSKWARKTRPWNANPQTTVVASISMEEEPYLEGILEDIEFMSTAPTGTVDTNDVFRPQGRRRWQGFLGKSLLPSCPGWAAASTAPPSRGQTGGGDRECRPGL
jgi:hypothetical protein